MPLSIVEFRDSMSDPLNRVAYQGERIILERHGKPVAALVPMNDLALLEAIEDREDITAARKALREKGSIPLAQVKAELAAGKAPR
jgi:antitoxin (DNA-binding transcriptional repressor) of toxin-antitoxin stability system